MTGPVSVDCPYCGWSVSFPYDHIRNDQTIFMEAWQHLQTSHRAEAKPIRSMQIEEIKRLMMSWAVENPPQT